MQVELGLRQRPAADRLGTVWTARLCSRCAVEEGAEVEGGLAVGDHADGLGLADVEGVGVAEGFELGGLVTDQVVEGGEVQGVAGDLEVGGADPVVGTVGADPAVVQPHPPRVPAVLLPGLQQLRVVGGDGLGDRELDRPPPTRADPVRELGVHRRGGGLGEVVGGLGDLAGLPRRHRQCFDGAQRRGSRCWRSRASANSWSPVRVDTPSAAANGSGVNAATSGVPSPPEGCLLPGTGPGGRCRTRSQTPTPQWPGAVHTTAPRPAAWRRPAWRSRTSASAAKSSSHSASRLETSTRAAVQHRLQHDSIQAGRTDISAPESG